MLVLMGRRRGESDALLPVKEPRWLPQFGDRLLKEIDTEFLMGFKASLLTQPGLKASAEQGSGKPLSARTVAKILTLIGTVFRYGKRIKLVTDNPASEVRKPKAPKKAVYILQPEEIALSSANIRSGRLRVNH